MPLKLRDFLPPIFYKILNRIKSNRKTNTFTYDGTVVNSFSQYGEDLIIDSLLGLRNSGFYIDIGANEPTKINNTKRFYDRGWRGINIEPNPALFELLEKERTEDINLNIGIGSKCEQKKFYELSLNAHSTFNKRVAKQITSTSKLIIKNEYNVQVMTLNNIYRKYVKTNHVDFISIDTEGLEEEILLGNSWDINRPTIIIIEMGEKHEWIYNFFVLNKYHPVCFNHVNAIFIDTVTL